MASRFPGMNPYLEQDRVWSDFHDSFIPAARDALAAQMPLPFIAKINEHLFIHEMPEAPRRLLGRADSDVTEAQFPPPGSSAATASVEAPAKVRLPALDIERQPFIEIRDRDGWQLVTVLELLRPSNKYAGSDRDQYLVKRQELLASGVNLVEVDLLRGGPRMPMEDLPDCDYCVLVSQVQTRPEAEVWPIRLREPLPPVPVPLRPSHGDVRLQLQALLHRVYDAARYATFIYLGEPQPELSPADAAWAKGLLPVTG